MEKKTDDRENDIPKICNGILIMSPESTGDSGSGARCPFCYADAHWNANDITNIEHESHCVYLIAKYLSTGF